MAKPRPLQNLFAGMFRDRPQNRLPPNYLWNVVNMLPDLNGPLASRRGWDFHSTNLGAVSGSSALYPRGGVYAVFSPTAGADAQNLAVDEDGQLYKIAEDGTPTLIGQAAQIAQNPVFHGGTSVSGTTAATAAVYTGLVIIPDANGAQVPYKYNGTTLSALAGNPPKAKFATVYKDFTVLGNGSIGSGTAATHYPHRIWFSPPGDPDAGYSGEVTAWDTTDSWIDFSLPVAGLAATKNALLVFHERQLTRIRGSTPPPDEDMINDDPFLEVGLLDPFSISNNEEFVYWCAPEGVYRTDGVVHENLCKKGGMVAFWSQIMDEADSSWTFTTGVLRQWLFVAVRSGVNGDFKYGFMINLDNFSWWRMTNFDFVSFWGGQLDRNDELFAAHSNSADSVARVARMSGVFGVPAQGVVDGDDTLVQADLESAYFELGRPGLKRIRRVFIGYAHGVGIISSPTSEITMSFETDPHLRIYGDSSAANDSGTGAEYRRKAVNLNRRAPGFAVRIRHTGGGDTFTLHDIGAEVMFQEESKTQHEATFGGGFEGGGLPEPA